MTIANIGFMLNDDYLTLSMAAFLLSPIPLYTYILEPITLSYERSVKFQKILRRPSFIIPDCRP